MESFADEYGLLYAELTVSAEWLEHMRQELARTGQIKQSQQDSQDNETS